MSTVSFSIMMDGVTMSGPWSVQVDSGDVIFGKRRSTELSLQA